MNFYKKYKSNIIAVLFTVLFNGFIILFLVIIPIQDRNAEDDFSILLQNDMFEELPPLSAPSDSKNEEKTKPSAKEHGKEAVNEKPVNEKTDHDLNSQTVSSGPESVNIEVKKDSVLISDLKQELKEIQAVAPKDSSVPAEVVENKPTTQDILLQDKRRLDEDRKFYRDNYRAIMNLKAIYPYVIKTKQLVENLDLQLSKIKDKREKQRLIKKMEKELFDQFEKDVRRMSTSQGALLLKLIARETNQSGYSIIKNYKGTLPATFWYGVGKLFREDLKTQYDSVGRDAALEKIVIKYKQGKF